MSSTQTKSLTINGSNATTYLSKVSGDAQIPLSWSSGTRAWGVRKNGGSGTVKLTASAMDKLFPNATAHPTSMTFTQSVNRLSVIASGAAPTFKWHVDDTEIIKNENITSGSFNSYTYTITSSAVKNSKRSSVFDIYGQAGTIILIDTATIAFDTITVSADFTRYDFSATAGTGVTSASVSSSTGYDGDTVTFSCVIPTGYVFDGWYNGTTLVSSSQSYTHTVNGADLTLTAKAHQNTHNVNGTYNGSTKAILTGITGDVGVTYWGKTKTMPTDATEFSLGETGKAMHTDVVVGSAALHCAELLMRSPLILEYTGYTPPLMRLLNLNRIISTSVTTDPNYAVTNFQRSYGTTDGQIQNITYTQNSLTFNEGCNAGMGTCFPLTLAVGRSYRLKWTASGETDTARIYLTGYTNGVYDSGMFGTSGSINSHIGAQTYDFTVPSGATTVCITFGAQTGKMVSYTDVELIEL